MGKHRGLHAEIETRFRVFAKSADGVFAIDPGGHLVLWNQAATRILGIEEEKALGSRCCDLLAGLDVSGNLICYPGCQVMILSAREQPIHHFDLRTRHKDGREVWLNVSTIIVPAEGDQPGGTVHLFRDVTQERQVSRLLKRTGDGTGRPARERRPTPGPDVTASGKGPADVLTRREREVLHLIAAGLRTSAIADRLCISHTTVRNHTQHILGKLGAHSRLEAVTVVFGAQLLASVSQRSPAL